MGTMSIAHWGLLLLIAFLLLGKNKFSAAMSNIGHGLRSFRKGLVEDPAPVPIGETTERPEPLVEPSSPPMA